MKHKQEPSAAEFLWLALYAFLGVGLEIGLILVESRIYNHGVGDFSAAQNIAHWTITSAMWIGISGILLWVARNRFGLGVMSQRRRPASRHVLLALLVAGLIVLFGSSAWGGFKPLIEWQRLGGTLFVFQYLYYLAESLLVTLMVVFGQQWGSRAFRQPSLPWGGLVAGITWGLMHILTKGDISAGLFALIAGIAYGMVYLLLARNVRWSYALITAMFVL